MGEHVGLRLLLRDGCAANIDWGDGKTERAKASDVWGIFPHDYAKKGAYYTIVITSDDEDGIIGFHGDCFFEVHTESVDVSQCPSLEYFGFDAGEDMKDGIDVSRNVNLKGIIWNGIACQKVDFSANVNLETLTVISCQDMKSLNVSKNNKLWKLHVNFCNDLSRIAVSNHTALRDVDLLFVNLDKNSMTYLRKVVDANGGVFKTEQDDEMYES